MSTLIAERFASVELSKRLRIAIIAGLAAAVLAWLFQVFVSHTSGDFGLWPMTAGRDLLHGLDPYRYPVWEYWVPYPLPAALVGLPFSFFPAQVGGAIFFGISTGLLAYGLTKDGFERLRIFYAMPFFIALIWTQWSPLVMASAFFPLLLPVVLIKPQIAIPVGLTNITKAGIIACVVVLLISFVIYPTWPFVWLSQLKHYQRFFPITTPLGPLMLLCLFRWHDKDAQYLLWASIFPQRYFYDAFVLWLIPKTKREILPTVILSWGAGLWRLFWPEMTSANAGMASVLFFFLPMLCVVLLRNRRTNQTR